MCSSSTPSFTPFLLLLLSPLIPPPPPQGELVAEVLGKESASLLGVPIGIFDVIVNGLQWAADKAEEGLPVVGPQAELSEKLNDAAEFGRIGRYYAVVDMLTTDPSEKYGKTTLKQHYERVATEGQES